MPEPDQYQDTGWWRTHFSGAILDLWQAIVPSEQAGKDADFLQARCQLAAGAKVLDVPCGNGRVALELAARGCQLVGVDIAEGMIDEARRQASRHRLAIEWQVADMRDLPWENLFDAAICWGDSFGYLDEAGNAAYLAAVQRVLVPGGRWAMDMKMVAEVLFPRYRAEAAAAAGGMRVQIRRTYDPCQGRLAVEYVLTRDGVEERRLASYRIYTCSEVCQLLQRAGFDVGPPCDAQGEPFRIGSDCLRIVGVKR